MDTFHLYKDIQTRTNGEIYLGVVGPVRTGKSTFIKRFMDLLVIPKMADENAKMRTKDELPQSASGRTIMTTEPKFVPKEAAEIMLGEGVPVKVRLIDCVGYMVKGAAGHIENEEERQVKTPWFDVEIPFTKAASIGTKKVIHDHATIGIVITTDGTIGELGRENYIEPEKQTIEELQAIKKPFLVLVNTVKPYGNEAKAVVEELKEKYGVEALAVNCEQLREEDIHHIMEKVLFEFPVVEVEFYIPKWVEMLPRTHCIKEELLQYVKEIMDSIHKIQDVGGDIKKPGGTYLSGAKVQEICMDTGTVRIQIEVAKVHYYEMLSEMTGMHIESEYELLSVMKKFSTMQKEFENVKDALSSVRMKGYGMVSPKRDEIKLEEPVIIRQGNKYGVKIKSQAPSIHLIRANIETEIAPIVGDEKQAQDLAEYIKAAGESENGMWDTNIFGKSIEDLVEDGMRNKMSMITEESQSKLQDTMQKIVNDSNGGMVCIII